MRLRNKKTGEIIDDGYVRETHDFQFDGQKHVLAVFKGNGHRPPERVSGGYTSLAELNEDWEDAPEESKVFFEIEWSGDICKTDAEGHEHAVLGAKQIGNYFSSREEAELAVRKLKAFKRLKDEGFRIDGWHYQDPSISGIAIGINASFDASKMDILNSNCKEDLTICFGKMF